MYLVFTIPFSVHVLRIYDKIIVDFERLFGSNSILFVTGLKILSSSVYKYVTWNNKWNHQIIMKSRNETTCIHFY